MKMNIPPYSEHIQPHPVEAHDDLADSCIEDGARPEHERLDTAAMSAGENPPAKRREVFEPRAGQRKNRKQKR